MAEEFYDIQLSEPESNNELESDPDNDIEVVDIDEYEYDIDALKNPINNLCLKCSNKFSSVDKLAVCWQCFREMSCMKTDAKKLYKLTDNDLEELDYYSRKNSYGGYTCNYFLKEIRLKAIDKRFGILEPSIDTYRNCINIIMEEAQERKIKTKERGEKMKETRLANIKKKQAILEKEINDRRKILDKALKKKKIVYDYNIKYYNRYVYGSKHDDKYDKYNESESESEPESETDLNKIVELIAAYVKRKEKLEAALQNKQLSIRDDSYYCNQYLEGKQFTLEEVVDMMEIMNFFVNKTNYFQLLKQYTQQRYDNEKEYGDWDGQRIEISESEKEKVKIDAFKAYAKKNPTESLPKSVKDKYLVHIQKCKYCNNNSIHYVMEPTHDILCNYCDAVKHEKDSIKLLLCSIICNKLYWKVAEYLTKKRGTEQKIIFCLENDKCRSCGKKDNSVVLFKGKRI